MYLRVMAVWFAFHTLYLGFIRVLGHWSEVGVCEESSASLSSASTWLMKASTFLGVGKGLAHFSVR